jgi:hypothetical protein
MPHVPVNEEPGIILIRASPLARNKNILDAVESLIGPDILLFGASLFSKKARDVRFVSRNGLPRVRVSDATFRS